MNNFQTILTAIFLAIFVFAVLVFSGVIKIGDRGSGGSGSLSGNIVVWGTVSDPDLYQVFEVASGENRDLYIKYVKKDLNTYQQELIEAFAKDSGPDLFFITPDMIMKNKEFFYKIPYSSYPEKTFRTSFIDGAEIFLETDGIVGLPILVDPMMMYYNKNLIANQGLANPPAYWDELFNLNGRLTKRENSGTILQSMIALGRYDNINNSKEILSSFLLQSGNSIVTKLGDKYTPVLDDNSSNFSRPPLQAILEFMMEFSDPSNIAYSWNRSLPNSFNMFTSGKLAIYLGKASELFKIESTNPNLSFDVREIIQTKNTPKRTYGDIYAVSVNKKSKNLSLAFQVAGLLSSNEVARNFSNALSLPPASRTLLSEKPEGAYMYTFYNSAIVAKTWADPDKKVTDSIFGEMFDNILSNRMDIDGAINRAQSQFKQIIK